MRSPFDRSYPNADRYLTTEKDQFLITKNSFKSKLSPESTNLHKDQSKALSPDQNDIKVEIESH